MPVNVLVVDDSAFMRKMISDMINSDPRLKVIATARDGEDALQKVRELDVHVITLDVQMPRMDGLTFLKHLMQERPLPVVMLSSLTQEGSQTTLDALALGAVDFVPKPSGAISLDIETVKDQLLRKIRAAARARVRPLGGPAVRARWSPQPGGSAGQSSAAAESAAAAAEPAAGEAGRSVRGADRAAQDAAGSSPAAGAASSPTGAATSSPTGARGVASAGAITSSPATGATSSSAAAGARRLVRVPSPASGTSVQAPPRRVWARPAADLSSIYAGSSQTPEKVPLGGTPRVLIALGASTGGPQALEEVLTHLPPYVRAGIVITQHMPPGFTRSYAARLDSRTHFTVREAQEGDALQEGLVLVAPGDYHMVITPSKRISLNQDPPVEYVRPAADVMMRSVAAVYGKRAVGVVLTGMGRDGAKGMKAIKDAGGRTLVQDESTSVIFSMPSAVIALGAADEVLPLHEIPHRLAHHWRELEDMR